MGLDDWPVTTDPDTGERWAHRWKDHWEAKFNTWCGIDVDPERYVRLSGQTTGVKWCPTCWAPIGATS